MNKLLSWFRNLTDVRRMAEINRLLTRSARRCVRDLGHAIQEIPESPHRQLFVEREKQWSEIFWDCSQYRDQLYETIDSLETQNTRLREQLEKAGIEEVPF